MSSFFSQVGVVLVILIIALVVLRICIPSMAKPAQRTFGMQDNRRSLGGFPLQRSETRILPQFTVEWNDGRRKHSAPLYGKEDGFLISRQDADLVLVSDYVSSPHARVEEDSDGRLWLEDLDSLNGTKQRGQRIQRVQITDGLALTLGDVELIFHQAGGAQSVPRENRPANSTTRQFRR